jgi:putative phosphoesterase
MRILIVSDIHANPWALDAVERSCGPCDPVLFAGDAVNYGARPREVVAWLRGHAAVAVRGNHDHAVAFSADPRAAASKQSIALAMRDWTRGQLSAEDRHWLGELPLTLEREFAGVTFGLCHATPADPLFDYSVTPTSSDRLLSTITDRMKADVLVLGHTHLPMVRYRGSSILVNPGSVGQPLDGDPRVAYAVWEDRNVSLRRAEYDIEAAIGALRDVPLRPAEREVLARTLRTGRIEKSEAS